MNLSRAAPLDLIGVGFGPSNLALAIALQERGPSQGELDVAVSRQAGRLPLARQHPGDPERVADFLPQGPGDPAQPDQPLLFVNYLKHHGRLVDFINLGTFYPCRMEYNDYLRWVAGAIRSAEPLRRRSADHRAGAAQPAGRSAAGDLARYPRAQQHVRTTRSVVVSAGGTPRIPEAFKALKDDEPRCSTTPSTWRRWPSSRA